MDIVRGFPHLALTLPVNFYRWVGSTQGARQDQVVGNTSMYKLIDRVSASHEQIRG